mmetsp:Transcript_26134/g.26537  ORF Transcript_26134/g.26537 Transcript_26134/m.26537 type:complete len:95 (+) Transcript_26134:989-1273(+)
MPHIPGTVSSMKPSDMRYVSNHLSLIPSLKAVVHQSPLQSTIISVKSSNIRFISSQPPLKSSSKSKSWADETLSAMQSINNGPFLSPSSKINVH